MTFLLKKYWLSTLVLLIILVLCFMKTTSFPAPPVRNFDKLVHTIMFLGLAGVIFFDNTRYLRFPISKVRIFWSTFIFPIALGGLIEILQANLTTYRSGDWSDFLFDVVGALIGWGIASLINHYLVSLRKTRINNRHNTSDKKDKHNC